MASFFAGMLIFFVKWSALQKDHEIDIAHTVRITVSEEQLERAKRTFEGMSEKDLEELMKLREELKKLKLNLRDQQFVERIGEIENKMATLLRALDKPPVITLSEVEGFTFAFGSAKIPDNFAKRLATEIIPSLVERLEKFQANEIQIVGHTDAIPPARSFGGDIDYKLLPYLNGNGVEPKPTSNVDLGMVRAATVARYLMDSGKFDGINVVAYSAGQAITPQGQMALDQDVTKMKSSEHAVRRRIEIILRRRPGNANTSSP